MEKIITIKTSKEFELVDLTKEINDFIAESKVKEGLLFAFLRHTSASLVVSNKMRINDLLNSLKKIITEEIATYPEKDVKITHACLVNLFINGSILLPIKDGKLDFGSWQSVFLIDFVGLRPREILLKAITL